MKRMNRLLIGIVCVAALLVSWTIAVNSKSNAQKQDALIQQAKDLMADRIYIRAVPLLEEAAGYQEAHTLEAEETLKTAYLQLLDQKGIPKKYTELLKKQMQRADASPAVYMEAAQYYLERSKLKNALPILREGIEKTGDEALIDLYEQERYQFHTSRNYYFDVTEISNGMIQVKLDSGWGLADARGQLLVPCKYSRISSYSAHEAIAQEGGEIIGVDENGCRIELLHEAASDFKNYSQNRLWLKLEDGWHIATGDFKIGSFAAEDCGMFSDGASPAKKDGKWGLIKTNGTEWLMEPTYDAIICDELGRAYAQKAVFIRDGKSVFMIVDGRTQGDFYEDARPFADGWAAVKKNGKWGFVDTEGNLRIDYQFRDARSFSEGLAAVQTDEGWGYLSQRGEIVIEPTYRGAKSFSNGCAPVLTAQGWLFISLLEYEGESGL